MQIHPESTSRRHRRQQRRSRINRIGLRFPLLPLAAAAAATMLVAASASSSSATSPSLRPPPDASIRRDVNTVAFVAAPTPPPPMGCQKRRASVGLHALPFPTPAHVHALSGRRRRSNNDRRCRPSRKPATSAAGSASAPPPPPQPLRLSSSDVQDRNDEGMTEGETKRNGGGGGTASAQGTDDGAKTAKAKADEARRTVEASASIDLPFPARTAFDAFTDFPRQPSWSDWLRSVEYIDDDGQYSGSGKNEEVGIRPSRWTARLFGLRYSWTSEGTEYVRGESLGWRSTSGMRTSGRVVFEEMTEDIEEGGSGRCRVTLTMSVRAPRAVAAVFRRSGALEGYFRDKILGGTLVKFRDVVMEEDVRSGGDGGGSGG